MSKVKTKGTKAEVQLRKALYAKGYRYRVNYKKLPGKPDIVLTRYKVAVFVHGCFWHQHPNCKYAAFPKTNHDFWQKKFCQNAIRDSRDIQQLLNLGWTPIIVWECEIEKSLDDAVMKVIETI